MIGIGRRLPLQGRPRGPRPRLRDVRVPGRAHRGVLLDRVERLRQLLRDVLGHEGTLILRARPRPASSRKGGGERDHGGRGHGRERRGRRSTPRRAGGQRGRGRRQRRRGAADHVDASRDRPHRDLSGFCAAVRVGHAAARAGRTRPFDSARACIRANEAIEKKARLTSDMMPNDARAGVGDAPPAGKASSPHQAGVRLPDAARRDHALRARARASAWSSTTWRAGSR